MSLKEVRSFLDFLARSPASDFCDFAFGTSSCCIASLMFCAMRGILDQIGAVESVKAASDIVESSALRSSSFFF